MKSYAKPTLELIALSSEDILATSEVLINASNLFNPAPNDE